MKCVYAKEKKCNYYLCPGNASEVKIKASVKANEREKKKRKDINTYLVLIITLKFNWN